jgi:[pyruvate, water dikinase]-phosphate phosphotransferase / [pyruvate, water dikinase] kinase
MTKTFHLHLVSDASGEISELLARAVVAQLENVKAERHMWNMVREQTQVDEVLAGVTANPGFVFHSVVEPKVRHALENGCRDLGVPHLAILEPFVLALARHLDAKVCYRPAARHVRDADYFKRIEAMRFILRHDDGQSGDDLDDAEIVLVGVSRTSKTPTCIYLANRGIKTANIPIVPGCPLPISLTKVGKPFFVGLTMEPMMLVRIRRERLDMLKQTYPTDYTDIKAVSRELTEARRLFASHGWPVVDVTHKPIEETAATILQIYERSAGTGR